MKNRELCRRAVPCAAVVAGVLLASGQVAAIVSSNGGANPPFSGIHINTFVGADTWYNAGYTGTNAVVANIEGGHIWSGHETLGHVTTFLNAEPFGTQLGEFDWHATLVGQAIAGRKLPGDAPGSVGDRVRSGIAFGSTLWSGAFATGWNTSGSGGTYIVTTASLRNPYIQSLITGVDGRTADVINNSWGGTSPTGFDYAGVLADALGRASKKLLVFSAGNQGANGPNSVRSPGSAFNVMAVGALGSDTDASPYDVPSSFTSFGPNDYYDPNFGTVVPGVRAPVDIAAPGQNLTLAFYGGTTGGNATGTPSGGPDSFGWNQSGTSVAAPIVAGGAALLVDYAYANYGENPNARDGRVLKSVLMNSAHKTEGWDNGQADIGGVIQTTQSLDYTVGAGRIDLARAFTQYTMGTTDLPGTGGGEVEPIGWDYGEVSIGSETDYSINGTIAGGSKFTATLNWFTHASYSLFSNGLNLQAFTDLDLQVWEVIGGVPTNLVAQSISLYNNAEHLHFDVPNDGQYMMRVAWAGSRYDFIGVNTEEFGLAWAATLVPGPGAFSLLALSGVMAVRRRRSC